jgi:NAD(P)-dependent dehydrogenase (short-subunit alcohol dehydrogenase family)
MAMAPRRFDGASVVLTGVGREGQVGEAIAAAFAAEGASLILLDRDKGAVEARAAALVATGATATAVACDLSDAEQVAQAAARIAAGSPASASRPAGRIDALVHIAGGFAMSGAIGESDPKVLDRMLQANLMTAYYTSRAFVPLVRDGGSVVYFASSYVLPGAPSARMSAYISAKSAVVGLMRSVADEGRARHLRANAVAPISVRTGDNIRDMGSGVTFVEREAVAGAVVFLCSHASRAITGQILRLSG